MAGLGAWLLAAGRFGAERGSTSPVVAKRMLRRNLRLARLGLRGGGRYGLHRARRAFVSAERHEALDLEFQIKTAEDVTAELGNMKGAMMKIGQMASYLDTGLPQHVRQTMASLQHDAPPMAPELAAEEIRRELGVGPDQLFLEWDEVPIASASIGQVHRALTHDGAAVAVKVQYPGVAEAIESDLRTNDSLFAALRMLFPGIDTSSITDELRERLSEELDYELEARNQAYFAEYFEGHPFVHVPPVLSALSTRRVLTSELVVGSSFAEVLEWSQEEKDLAAETLFRFSFGAIYRLAAFNGDPHPGNYLFHEGGRITFLDFGLVKHFSEADTRLFEALIVNMVVERDYGAFRREIEIAGLLPPGAPFSDELIGHYFSYFYDFVLEDREFTFDEDYSAAGVRQIFETGGEHGELKKVLNVPSSFVVLQRINFGLLSLFGRLGSRRNWRRIAEELWPFVDADPSTPMGEQIERWGRESGRRPSYGGL